MQGDRPSVNLIKMLDSTPALALSGKAFKALASRWGSALVKVA